MEEDDLPDFFPLDLDLPLPPLALSDDLPDLDLCDLDLLLFFGGDLEPLLLAPGLDLAILPLLLLLLPALRAGEAALLGGDAARLPEED